MKTLVYVGLDSQTKSQFLYKGHNELISKVAAILKVSEIEILSKSRKRAVVEARFILMNKMRHKHKMNLLHIGEALNRDHSTITYGLEMFNDLMNTDAMFKRKVELVNRILEE